VFPPPPLLLAHEPDVSEEPELPNMLGGTVTPALAKMFVLWEGLDAIAPVVSGRTASTGLLKGFPTAWIGAIKYPPTYYYYLIKSTH
jgi:hypothetical protein